MSNAILICSAIVILAIGMLWGFLRNLAKSRIRGISLILCAVGAVLLTIPIRNWLFSEERLNQIVIPWMEKLNMPEMVEMFGLSETLNEVLLGVGGALVAPIISLALFIVLSFLTWFVFLIVTLIFGSSMREYNEFRPFSRIRGMVWGAISALVILFVLMIPVSTYLGVASPVINSLNESDALGEDAAVVQDVIDEYVTPLDKNGVVVVFRTLGGKAITTWITDFKVDDTTTHLQDEIGSVASLAGNIISLTKTDIEEYDSEQAATFIAIADSFEDSVLLPTIAGELIYNASDAWLKGEAFMGAEKPDLGEMSEIFEDFFNTLLTILHDDAHDRAALQADVRTVAEMISVLAQKGVFANMKDTNALMEALSSNGVIESMISSLGNNDSMKILIPEITNMGVRAIATTLGLPADAEAVYNEFMDEVAVALNDVRDLPEEERNAQLTQSLTAAFDDAGVPIDREIVDCYVVSMSEDLLSSEEDLTSDDVRAFFTVYALNATGDAGDGSTEELAASGTLSNEDIFKGTVYEGKTEDELKKSGAAVLARVSCKLSALADNVNFAEQAAEILQSSYSELVSEDSAAMSVIKSVVLTKPVTEDTMQATAGLQSSESIVTVKVTISDLLIDTKQAANKINSQTIEQESQNIASIFSAASGLAGKMDSSELKLNEVTESVGEILDSLHSSVSYGSDKASNLVTAVFQSKTVRDVADLDMTTATQMAEKATEGNGNYKQTMQTIGDSVDVISKLGDGKEVTEDDLIKLIRNINPQSAGMIELFVTPARIAGYGVDEKYASTSAPMISDIFAYMADTDMTDEEYEKEAKALNQVLNIAISAKSHASEDELFGGILPSATETVNTFVDSKAVSSSLRKNMLDENGNVLEGKFDVFELGEKIPEDSENYQEFVDAVKACYENDRTADTKATLTAITAILGISVELD